MGSSTLAFITPDDFVRVTGEEKIRAQRLLASDGQEMTARKLSPIGGLQSDGLTESMQVEAADGMAVVVVFDNKLHPLLPPPVEMCTHGPRYNTFVQAAPETTKVVQADDNQCYLYGRRALTGRTVVKTNVKIAELLYK